MATQRPSLKMKRGRKNTAHVGFRVPPELKDRLRAISESGVDVAEEVRAQLYAWSDSALKRLGMEK